DLTGLQFWQAMQRHLVIRCAAWEKKAAESPGQSFDTLLVEALPMSHADLLNAVSSDMGALIRVLPLYKSNGLPVSFVRLALDEAQHDPTALLDTARRFQAVPPQQSGGDEHHIQSLKTICSHEGNTFT